MYQTVYWKYHVEDRNVTRNKTIRGYFSNILQGFTRRGRS